MRAPSDFSASTRSPMGRSSMRATPDSRYSPSISASTAVRGRYAVPALPSASSAFFTGNAPLAPRTRTVCPPSSTHETPRVRNASSMTRVSSDSKRSWTRVSPRARPASNKARLEMLLEPGSLTVPRTRRMGPRSRYFKLVSSLRPLPDQPLLARVTRLREHALQLGRIRALDGRAHCLELVFVVFQGGQQRVAVRDADIGPH